MQDILDGWIEKYKKCLNVIPYMNTSERKYW